MKKIKKESRKGTRQKDEQKTQNNSLARGGVMTSLGSNIDNDKKMLFFLDVYSRMP